MTFAFGSLLEWVERDGGGAAAVPGRLRGAAPQWLTAPDRLPNERPPTPPGERLLEEFVKPLGVSQSALASRLGVPRQRLDQLLRAQSTITPDTALRLARIVGMSADFWLGLQQDWDLWHATRSEKAAEIAQL